jgi:propanol-preferring alcohol dehydrogenase
MLAYRLLEWATPKLAEVPDPQASPGHVVIKVGGAGLCGTDIKLMAARPGSTPFEPPFTLGHEIAGWIHEVGDGVTGLEVGDAVAVSAGAFCGRCELCLAGNTNYCPTAASGRGFGADGGLAEFVVASQRHVLPIGALSPADAAPLTDAAATAYHTVRQATGYLRPGSVAVVIGAGGLGGYAIQFLRLLTPATVVAIDVSAQRLEFATRLGAHVALPAADDNADIIRELGDGAGAHAVLDFVGTESAVRTAMAAVRSLGVVRLVGGAGGSVPFGHTTLPRGVDIQSPIGSTALDLRDVVRLAQDGHLHIETERYPLTEVEQAYDALRSGRLLSRAVVTP